MLDYAISVLNIEAPHLLRGSVRAVFHRMATTQLTLKLATGKERCERPQSPIADFIISGPQNETVYIWYVENGEKVSSSLYYPEERVFEISQIEGCSISLAANSPLSFVETLVSMTKALHTALFPEAKGWLFCRLELKKLLPDVPLKGMRVKLTNRIGALTRSSISMNEDPPGSIYFSQTEYLG
jgi:hypothetical protein